MENNENLLVEDYGEQVRIRREKLSALTQEGKNPYEQTKFIVDTTSNEILGDFANYENKSVRIAGRILSRRMMGKASFAHLLDSKGKIQIYVKRDNVGEDVYAEWKKADIGDIYGIEGTVFMTHSGEVSVSVTAMTMLSKSLLPLPEKFHGLKDNDLRYRQRYVDLIANPEVKENFVVRSRIIKAIRDLLDSKGFVEVETPVLNTIAGGASARPFITHHNTLDLNMYMRIAPELYLKRLIVGGFDKVYEIGKMFRNEGMDVKHNPEFTMMELYQAYADYNDMMDITEEIYHAALTAAGKGDKITYEGVEIDLTSPWERLTMLDAIKRYVGIDFDKMNDAEALEAAGSADLIIYVGGLNKNWRQDCESGDRQTYNLPFCQDRLITSLAETGKPMVTVFLTGNAFAMPWIDKVDAIVQAWYIGSESGHPIADILSGDVCPSGKLPITYPVALADCGAHSFDTLCFPGDSINTEYREDILVGYRWHDTKNVKPLFPFGYGLSYTTFEYGKAKVEVSEGAWTVSVPVTNTGSVKGKEVVQLYVGDDKASVIRPKKELKAFEKIEINPGETKTAKLTITEQDLKFWDEAKHEWTLEPGTFTFYVAASSADIKQKIKVKK